MTYLIIGLGQSGIAAANFLVKSGENVLVYDKDKHKASELIKGGLISKNCGIITKLCAKTLCIVHCIVLSPGVKLNKKVLHLAREFKINIIGELAFAASYCPAPIYAITGTNGKTTVCKLLGAIFNAAKYNTHLVGNIGNAFSGVVDSIAPNDKVVCEVSSFQLEYSAGFTPTAVAFTNIAPDHLDRYRNFQEYFDTKKILLERVGSGKIFLNFDDVLIRDLGKDRQNCEYYSTAELPAGYDGLFVRDNKIFRRVDSEEHFVLDLSKNKLVGKHNISNILCATCLALYGGVLPEIIAKAIKNFRAPHHRIEFVGKVNGAYYFDDSKATNINSTITAVSCFPDKRIILLLGGSDKGENYNNLIKQLPENVTQIIAFGETGRKIAKIARKTFCRNIFLCKNLYTAFLCARAHAHVDDVVLLSPACASFDEFANYRERGEYFCSLVKQNDKD